MNRRMVITGCALSLGLSGCGVGSSPVTGESYETFEDEIRVTEASKEQFKAVYGDDSRREVYASADFLKERARQSIVTLMPLRSLSVTSDDKVQISSPTLGQTDRYCDSVPFLNQPTAGTCSGTLIDDDLIMTAGHCITSLSSCQNNAFVFDYFLGARNTLESIERDDVYFCDEIVAQSNGVGGDYAVVRLDRSVNSERRPAQINRNISSVQANQSISMIGAPSGLPLKVENDGLVQRARSVSSSRTFEAYIDAFGGNSGSGVFDQNGNVIGILVAGAEDFQFSGGCVDVARFSTTGFTSETITFSELAFSQACANGLQSAHVCGNVDSDVPVDEPEQPSEVENTDSSELCVNTCRWAFDGECDDGRPGAPYSGCALGTDCGDCGSVAIEDAPPVVESGVCRNTCQYANDGECDDGGSGSQYNVCSLGSDCGDCGIRN